MARWLSTSTPSSDLREQMADRAEATAEMWKQHAATRPPVERAYVERMVAAETGRWRSDEAMHVDAWQLPTWARGGIHPSTRVVVTAAGNVEHAQPHNPNLRLIDPTPIPPQKEPHG